MPSCTVRGAAAALFATVSLMVVPGDAASAYGSGATTSRSVYELTAAAKRRALQGIALTLCPPQLTFNGPLWANATGLPEDMYLAFLYISADGAPGGSATTWLDRTLAAQNNVLLPGEEPLATGANGQAVGIEVYDPSFIDVQTWSTLATDVNATRMALYVVPTTRAVQTALRAYTPPTEPAGGPVPAVITSNAVASAIVTRTRNAAAACNSAWENIDIPDLDTLIPDGLLPSPTPRVRASSGAGSVGVTALTLTVTAAVLARLSM